VYEKWPKWGQFGNWWEIGLNLPKIERKIAREKLKRCLVMSVGPNPGLSLGGKGGIMVYMKNGVLN
jgi:hypothetical protein